VACRRGRQFPFIGQRCFAKPTACLGRPGLPHGLRFGLDPRSLFAGLTTAATIAVAIRLSKSISIFGVRGACGFSGERDSAPVLRLAIGVTRSTRRAAPSRLSGRRSKSARPKVARNSNGFAPCGHATSICGSKRRWFPILGLERAQTDRPPAMTANITSVQPSTIRSIPTKSPMTQSPEIGHERQIERPSRIAITPLRMSHPR
jgi:hypothetical protein